MVLSVCLDKDMTNFDWIISFQLPQGGKLGKFWVKNRKFWGCSLINLSKSYRILVYVPKKE